MLTQQFPSYLQVPCDIVHRESLQHQAAAGHGALPEDAARRQTLHRQRRYVAQRHAVTGGTEGENTSQGA